MAVRVRELTSNATVTVGPGHTLRDAAQLMDKHRVGSAVVLDGESLAGIITERDVLRAAASGEDLSASRVSEWMTPDPQSAGPETPAADSETITRAWSRLSSSTSPWVTGSDWKESCAIGFRSTGPY